MGLNLNIIVRESVSLLDLFSHVCTEEAPFPGIRSSNFTKSEKYLNHDGSEKYLEFVLNYLRSEEHVIG